MNPEQQLTQSIMDEKKLESDARKATELLNELSSLMTRMNTFAKDCGSRANDPVGFCKAVIMQYGMKKLESLIITPQ